MTFDYNHISKRQYRIIDKTSRAKFKYNIINVNQDQEVRGDGAQISNRDLFSDIWFKLNI